MSILHLNWSVAYLFVDLLWLLLTLMDIRSRSKGAYGKNHLPLTQKAAGVEGADD